MDDAGAQLRLSLSQLYIKFGIGSNLIEAFRFRLIIQLTQFELHSWEGIKTMYVNPTI